MRSLKTVQKIVAITLLFTSFVCGLGALTASKTVFADSTLSLLATVKGAGPDSKVRLGQTLTINYKLDFNGDYSVSHLAIKDNGILVSCPTTTMQSGSTVTCTGTYKVTATDIANGSITHTAVAIGSLNGTAVIDAPIASNNSTYSVSATTQAVAAAALSLDVVASGTFQGTGDTIGYSYTVTNTGQQRLSGLSVAASPSFGVKCAATTIASGASTTCSGSYKASSSDNRAGKVVIANVASAKSSSGKTIKSSKITNTVAKSKTPVQNASNGSGIEASTLPQTTASRGTIDDLLNVVFGIIGGVAVLVVAVGGLRYILANGDPNAITQAKNTIFYALIGLVVAISGFSIVTFVVSNIQ